MENDPLIGVIGIWQALEISLSGKPSLGFGFVEGFVVTTLGSSPLASVATPPRGLAYWLDIAPARTSPRFWMIGAAARTAT